VKPAGEGAWAAATIAVVVPTLNEASTLGRLLADLAGVGGQGDYTVTVADGGSTDGTLAVAARFPEVSALSSPRGRARQMNAGARASAGEILLFLHADCHLPAGAFPSIRAALADPAVAAGSFRLAFDREDPWLRFYAWCSRINHPLFTYGDQGLFLRRETFERVGGFPEIPLLEDVEIQRRLRREGRFIKLRDPVVTSARRFVKNGVVRQQTLNTGIVLLYYLGASPARLARFYDAAAR
jgi:rSAM/selenodomain-associated transferase 2